MTVLITGATGNIGGEVTDCIQTLTGKPANTYANFARDYAQAHRQDFFS